MAYKDKADQAAAARRHYEANKEKVKARAVAFKKVQQIRIKKYISEKKDVPCTDCGERFPEYVMDFDHLGDKLFSIANFNQLGKTFAKVVAEIEKCEVVCSNCHRVRTWQRRNSLGEVN